MATGLGAFQPRTERVPIDEKQDFYVRGISYNDITRLVQRHGLVMIAVYNQVMQSKAAGKLSADGIGILMSTAIQESPDAVNDLIATAADEPAMAPQVAKLPVMVQMDALVKIVELTFSGEAEVKRLVETVTRMSGNVAKALNELNSPETGSVSGRSSFAST